MGILSGPSRHNPVGYCNQPTSDGSACAQLMRKDTPLCAAGHKRGPNWGLVWKGSRPQPALTKTILTFSDGRAVELQTRSLSGRLPGSKPRPADSDPESIAATVTGYEGEELVFSGTISKNMRIKRNTEFRLLDKRPEIAPDQVIRQDVRPGLQFIWESSHEPMYPNDYVFEVIGKPRRGWVSVVRVGNPLPSGYPWNGIFLADAGIIPYSGGKWNANWLRIVKPAPPRHHQLLFRRKK